MLYVYPIISKSPVHSVQVLTEKKNAKGERERKGGEKNIRSKPRFIHPVVNIIINPAIHLLNLSLQFLGKQIHFLVLIRNDVVKRRIHHSNNLRTLITHNALRLFVVQCRHRKSSFIVGILLKVNIAEVRVVWVERVGSGVAGYVFGGRGKVPPFFLHVPVYARVGDYVLETLELPYDECAVRPGTGVGDVEVVAVCFWGEFCTGLVFNPVAEDGC